MRPFAFAAAVVLASVVSSATHAAPACRVKGRRLEVTIEMGANNELRAVLNNRVVETLILESGTKGFIKTSSPVDQVIADATQRTLYRTTRSVSFGKKEITLELQGNGNYGYTIFRKSRHDLYTVDSSDNYIAFAPQCSPLEALLGGYAIFKLSQK